jgi:hypothetical protein
MTPVRRLVGALIVTVALGLASRAWPIGFVVWDKVMGDALVAVAVHLLVATVATAVRRYWCAPVAGGIAVGICWAFEAFQATGWTARTISAASVRTALGTTFGFTDLVWYLIGVVAIALVDALWLRPGVGWRERSPTRSRSDW